MQKIQKRASFRHLDQKHRDRIHALYLHGHTQKHIAEIVGVTPGTISRELHRYGKKTWRYSSLRAQKDAEEKRTHSKCDGMKIEGSLVLKERVITYIGVTYVKVWIFCWGLTGPFWFGLTAGDTS